VRLDRDVHVGDGDVGADACHLDLGLFQGGELGGTKVDLELASFGHDVGTRASPNHADVGRHPRPPSIETLQCEDRVRRLQDRVASLLGLHAGMCGSTGDPDREVGDPFARRDDVAVRPGALQHQRGVVRRRELPDDRSGVRRADLLIRVADVGDRAESVEAHVLQDLGREEPREEARLHVGHSRTARDVAVDPERALGRRAVVEDRVHVPDQQDVRSARPPEPADQQIAEPRFTVVRTPLDLPTTIQEAALAHVGDPVDAVRRVRATVHVDHDLERFEELGIAGEGTVANGLHVHR
jgi:hypothetical protein